LSQFFKIGVQFNHKHKSNHAVRNIKKTRSRFTYVEQQYRCLQKAAAAHVYFLPDDFFALLFFRLLFLMLVTAVTSVYEANDAMPHVLTGAVSSADVCR